MNYIEIDESLKTGILLIDEQHLLLSNLINNFLDILRSNQKNNLLLQNIVEYINYHYKTELMLLNLYNFSYIDKYETLYNNIISNLNRFVYKYNNINDFNSIINSFNLLSDCILSHIILDCKSIKEVFNREIDKINITCH
jgi:hemerythrin-like metal-binding protein